MKGFGPRGARLRFAGKFGAAHGASDIPVDAFSIFVIAAVLVEFLETMDNVVVGEVCVHGVQVLLNVPGAVINEIAAREFGEDVGGAVEKAWEGDIDEETAVVG
jgi:hypothetical protein